MNMGAIHGCSDVQASKKEPGDAGFFLESTGHKGSVRVVAVRHMTTKNQYTRRTARTGRGGCYE